MSAPFIWSSRGVVLAERERPNGGIRCARRATARSRSCKLREAEKLQAQGLTIPQSCKRLVISDQTFYRWRIKYGALKEDEAQRLKALEQENTRLKKIVAEHALGISMLEGLAAGKMVSLARRRDAARFLQRRHKVSERRACRVVDSRHAACFIFHDASSPRLRPRGRTQVARPRKTRRQATTRGGQEPA